MPGVAFFACGTPSNNRGFELVEFGPERLPGAPEDYLDKAPADAAECHRIESILIGGQRHVEYSRVLRINPNDAEANRGAYVAVGCLIGERVALHTVANCVDVVSELYGRVSSALTAERSFPVGFRLADLAHTGAPLDERTAYPCSPLLVADVVLQAVNGEGSIDWANTRQVLLAPAEMLAADISRYQLYSRQGPLGSLASLDLQRVEVQQLARATSTAAEGLADVRQEWAALQVAAERLLSKMDALKRQTTDIDDSVKRSLSLGAEDPPAGGADGDGAAAAGEAGRAPYERYYYKGAAGSAAFSSLSRARSGQPRSRARGSREQRHWVRGPRWVSASVMVVVGALLAVGGFVALQKFRVSEVAQDAVPGSAVVVEADQTDGEEALEQPPNDVAKERAALDALPEE
jgi:hypothetical protein